MPIDRREFLNLVATGVAASTLLSPWMAQAATGPRIKAIVFDAFPILDPRPVFSLAEQIFPGKGTEISNAWRIRQFEYQWLRALAGQYVDFWQATEDALVFASRMLKLDLTRDKRDQLMGAYLGLKAWPDVLPTLQSLKSAGIRLAFLSNATTQILDAGIKNSKLAGMFEHVLSTDKIRTYKPDPRAYQMGVSAFGLKREEMLFVAFAAWDVAGAKWFGYPTFWANRLSAPIEELGVTPDATSENLGELVNFVKS